MPSAYYDKANDQWIANFRRLFSGKRKNVRLPIRGSKNKDKAKKESERFEKIIRQLEINPNNARIQAALKLKIITPDEADTLTGNITSPKQISNRLTIEHAYKSHPSTVRQDLNEAKTYWKYLLDFQEFSGTKYVEEITLEIMMCYVAHMKTVGVDSWHTREHKLRPVKRALAIGAGKGIQNPIAGFKIDSAENQSKHEIWNDSEIQIVFKNAPPKMKGIIALGIGFAMRPTEITQVTWNDYDGETICTGRKNIYSERTLPVAPSVASILDRLPRIHNEESSQPAPIIASDHHFFKGGHFKKDSLNNYFQKHTPDSIPKMPVKGLRKIFATRAIENGVDPLRIDGYMGHRIRQLSGVTNKNYLSQLQLKMFLPVADWIENYFQKLQE